MKIKQQQINKHNLFEDILQLDAFIISNTENLQTIIGFNILVVNYIASFIIFLLYKLLNNVVLNSII